jgi:hypothetical protein
MYRGRAFLQIIIIPVAIFIPIFLHSTAYGQDVPAYGCEATQRYLKNIQKPRDVRTRVDRLQAYRYIYQRLDVFTRRVERNNQPNAKNLRANVDRFYDATEAFRLNYETYDDAREDVVLVEDCSENSEDFAERLRIAREKRSIIAQDVALLKSIIQTNIPEELEVLRQRLEGEEL